MKHQHKRPVTKVDVQPSKVAKTLARPWSDGFTWSFTILDNHGPFGWESCQAQLLYILNKKRNFETTSRNDLRQAGSHPIQIHQLCKEAQKRLTEIHQEDIEALFSFRLSNKERLWCIEDGNVMKVLWWDPEHQVCPSELKNT